MSFSILNKKFDELNDKEKKIQSTFNVIGTNKYQHRYIKDLKDDFKEEMILKYPSYQDGTSKILFLQ